MMWFLGDIHGNMHALKSSREIVEGPLVQVGDFGFSSHSFQWLAEQDFDQPVYIMDGNHEQHGLLPAFAPGAMKVARNCWYVARGTILDIDGARVGFMGGACSIDKAHRQRLGWHWSALEVVTDEQVDRMIADVESGGPLDLLVTHTPPESLIQRHFDPMDKLRLFGVSPDWVGAGSSLRIDRLWQALGRPYLICGHMHRAVEGEGHRMLDVNELFQYSALRASATA